MKYNIFCSPISALSCLGRGMKYNRCYFEFLLKFIGLGFKRADGNKWIEHQDDFNSLLAELNEASASDQVSAAPVSEQEVAKSSVQSLEAKSKSSRSRVQ